jgi:glucan phosphoethanolaminetransferase (alkaline phosphatase superfamily)
MISLSPPTICNSARQSIVTSCRNVRAAISKTAQEQLVNTYDNTIRHTDYVLAQMIEKA